MIKRGVLDKSIAFSQKFQGKIIAFAILFFIEVFIIKVNVDFAYAKIDLADLFHLPQELPTFILTFILIFLLLSRDQLPKLKLNKHFSFDFLLINIISLIAFISLNSYMVKNSLMIAALPVQSLAIWYIFAFLTTLSLLFVFFKTSDLFDIFKELRNPIIISGVLAAVFLFAYNHIYKLWPLFSKIVGGASFFLLNLVVPATTLSITGSGEPFLALPNFRAVIGAPCSGIEGIALFSLLFVIFALYNWKYLNKKKVGLLFLIGIAGIFVLNILRVFILFLVGHFIDVKLAAGVFHTNLGWILYSIFIVILEITSYNWVRK